MSTSGFADRLTFVLKALSLSRGRLAADIGVDKSLVGRWCAGLVHPSAHSLERLTQHIAERQPGFTALDWDAELPLLAERFGVAVLPSVAASPLDGWLPQPMLDSAAAATLARGPSYEGLWRVTRPSAEVPGHFIHDHVLLRLRDDGVLGFTLGVMDIRFTGFSLPLQHQLFSIATDVTTGTFVFGIFNGVTRSRAEVIDGVVLTCMRDAGSTPVASKCLLTRIADLSDDPAADDTRFAELAAGYPLSAAADVPAHIRDHLWHECGPASLAAGGEAMMMMRFATSMSRGPAYEDQRDRQPVLAVQPRNATVAPLAAP